MWQIEFNKTGTTVIYIEYVKRLTYLKESSSVSWCKFLIKLHSDYLFCWICVLSKTFLSNSCNFKYIIDIINMYFYKKYVILKSEDAYLDKQGLLQC